MTDTWTWATVTQASPLRIKVDGDTTALDATTDNLVGSLAVDDRVRVHLHADGIIVTGLQGGGGDIAVYVLAGGENLNTKDTTGRYHQNLNADATSGTNYPINRAGLLEVAYGEGFVYQTYTAYKAFPHKYLREYYNGAWNSWREIASTAYADALVVTAPKGVIPSSVVVGSGSASVATDGTVTFTDVSSVSLNGVFDGLGGDSYQVTAYMAGETGAVYATRLRTAGTDLAGTSYDRSASYTQLAAGPTRASATGNDVFGFWCLTSAGTTRTAAGTMALLNPRAALASVMQLHATLNANSDLYDWHEGAKGPTTACDGLTILATAGTITGTIKVVKVS